MQNKQTEPRTKKEREKQRHRMCDGGSSRSISEHAPSNDDHSHRSWPSSMKRMKSRRKLKRKDSSKQQTKSTNNNSNNTSNRFLSSSVHSIRSQDNASTKSSIAAAAAGGGSSSSGNNTTSIDPKKIGVVPKESPIELLEEMKSRSAADQILEARDALDGLMQWKTCSTSTSSTSSTSSTTSSSFARDADELIRANQEQVNEILSESNLVRRILRDLDRDDGWTLSTERDGVTVHYRPEPGSPFYRVRTKTIYSDFAITDFVKFVSLFFENDLMPKWFPGNVMKSNVALARPSRYSKVIQTKLQFPRFVPISNRDAIVLGRGYQLPTRNGLIIFNRSINDPIHCDIPPPAKGTVRIHTDSAFYLSVDTTTTNTGKTGGGVRFQQIGHDDLKLRAVPPFVLNFVAKGRAPFENVFTLRKIIRNFAGSPWEERINANRPFYDAIEDVVKDVYSTIHVDKKDHDDNISRSLPTTTTAAATTTTNNNDQHSGFFKTVKRSRQWMLRNKKDNNDNDSGGFAMASATASIISLLSALVYGIVGRDDVAMRCSALFLVSILCGGMAMDSQTTTKPTKTTKTTMTTRKTAPAVPLSTIKSTQSSLDVTEMSVLTSPSEATPGYQHVLPNNSRKNSNRNKNNNNNNKSPMTPVTSMAKSSNPVTHVNDDDDENLKQTRKIIRRDLLPLSTSLTLPDDNNQQQLLLTKTTSLRRVKSTPPIVFPKKKKRSRFFVVRTVRKAAGKIILPMKKKNSFRHQQQQKREQEQQRENENEENLDFETISTKTLPPLLLPHHPSSSSSGGIKNNNSSSSYDKTADLATVC